MYFGIGLARLPDTDTQYSDDRREGINPSEIKSVKVMWVVEDSGDESETYIHNDGVLDITQDNPNLLNKLTVHFRESSKEITIPSGGGSYVLPPATDTTLGGIIVGDGLEITEEGVLSGNEYHAGTAISISEEDDTINVNIGQGLSVDNEDNSIVNEGVLDVSEKQSAPGVFTVSKRDADTDIDLFDSLGKITLNCNMNPD